MMHLDSPSTSSAYSPRSTIASSPEANLPDQKPTLQQLQAGHPFRKSLSPQYQSYNGYQSTVPNFNQHPPAQVPAPPPFNFDLTVSLNGRPSDAASGATAVSHQGSTRSEPPKRQIEVDGLKVVETPAHFLAQMPSMNRLLLQGDPQYITKQRVETAIRVIFDLLRLIPASPSDPPLNPQLAPLLLRDQEGNILTSIERIGTFRSIKLQAGTTTKTHSKKQQQAGPTPLETSLYLETAVYMSGNDGKRVYACKRCRMRETKRRQNKDANKKKASNSESDTPPDRKPDLSKPTETYITGANAEQYDPQKTGQVVEEPPWDPKVPDWRHEIVLFNSAPEVQVRDGSCVWLPFRVICYGKCHGEKNGFKVKFTLRTHTGAIIASSITNAIRITDDHKTDSKSRPKTEGPSNPAVPRAKKGRPSASAASSRRVSPTPSDVSNVSVSEAGAVIQKQTPHVRGAKPYDRPPSQSPLTAPLSMEGQFPPIDVSSFGRSLSSASLHSLNNVPHTDIMSQGMTFDQGGNGTVSPGILRQPAFDFTQFNGNSNAPSVIHSAASSNVASPIVVPRPLDNDTMLFGGDPLSSFASLHALEQQQMHGDSVPPPMMSAYGSGTADLDIANAMSAGLENLFDGSSHASSYADDASVFSGNFPEGSMFSDSGVVPDDDMQGFLDFTAGESEQALTQPLFYGQSPTNPISPPRMPTLPINQIPPVPPPQPAPNPATISVVIPAEGPVSGGTRIAVIGSGFAPGIVVMFGERTAKLEKVDPTVIQCLSPPSAEPGDVPIIISGSMPLAGEKQHYFKYIHSELDLLRLAMQVQAGYGQMNPAAYQLAQQFAARSTSGSDWSSGGQSSSSAGPSPRDDAGDTQTQVINFIASIDSHAPGSLRRSGCINMRNEAQQTLLHIATVMGYHRLVRRLVVIGAHLDLQDVNGYTPLGLASLVGQVASARVLIEAGAAYDRPTLFGEMPLDLAKAGEHAEVEALLLSAVWSTEPEQVEHAEGSVSAVSVENKSEIDDDNPSDGSDEGSDTASTMTKPRRRPSRRSRKRHSASVGRTSPKVVSRRSSLSATPQPTPIVSPSPADDPPPYDAHPRSERQDDTHDPPASIKFPLPDAVWDRLPVPIHNLVGEKNHDNGWVAFPAPSWETLQKMASPEEVRLFTQAMAAAAFNAVVQSGATTSSTPLTRAEELSKRARAKNAKRRRSKGDSDRSGSMSPRRQIAKQVKSDRMLYLFWLPILLFVGFWLVVTALPIATGFCLIYARQITRAIKQRI